MLWRRLLVASLALAACKPSAKPCGTQALEKAVVAVETKRAEQPAWFGDPTGGRLSLPLVRDELLKACPTLPDDLEARLGLLTDLSTGSRAMPMPMNEAQAERFRARRNAVCKDPRVFDEMGSLGPRERGPAMLARCGFEKEYSPRNRLGEALSRTNLFAPILRQHLLDGGTPPELAKRTVELLGFPFAAGQTTATLAKVERASGPPEGGLLLRATSEALVLANGPTLPLGDRIDAKALIDWIDANLPQNRPERLHLVLDIDATQPATTVAAVVAAVAARPHTAVTILVDGGRYIGAESFVPRRPDDPPSHVAAVEDQTLTVRAADPDAEPELESPLPGHLDAIARWAATAGPHTSVAIDPANLDVQALVDIVVALRGPDCWGSVMLDGLVAAPEACLVSEYGFVTAPV